MQMTLSQDTLISLGAVGTIVIIALPLTWKASKLLSELNATMNRLTDAIDDRIEHKDLINWVQIMRAKNPDMDIPHFPEKE